MFIVNIMSKDGEATLLTLKTEQRAYARGTKLLCEENNIPCIVTAEVKPREVKFKGIDSLTPAVIAKVSVTSQKKK